MITLYNPTTGTFQATTGGQQSPELVSLNVLIELRALTAIMCDAQQGLVTQTVQQYRSDAVNDSVNPVT